MNFEFILIGSDMNTYYMARSFHEEYHRKCYMIGTKLTVFTLHSNIFTFIQEPSLNEKEGFLEALTKFAKHHQDKKLILVGTNDVYVRLIIENEQELSKYYLFNYTNENLMNDLMNKELFYTKYKDYSISIPKTFIYSEHNKKIPNDFKYPVILKPSNTSAYFYNIIAGMPKIFRPESAQELNANIKMIEDSGYKHSLIIQEFIPGDDTALFDSVFYINKNKKAEFASFAQIGLQEHNKNAIGNATVLINGYNEHGIDESEKTILKLKKFLEDIGFQGLCEVDLKYDYRDKSYKVLEVNVRQGRCSYYLTAMGYNLTKCYIDDLLYNKEHPFVFIKDKLALSFVPKYVVKKYINNESFKKEIKKLYKEKKVVKPMAYNKDMNFKRKILILRRDLSYIKKYKESEW